MMMLFNILILIARIFLGVKFLWILVMNTVNPETYPLSDLDWFLYFLVFDIWIHSLSRNVKMDDDEDEITPYR
jgi:hypothetical protein